MSDQVSQTPVAPPMANDAAARSPTGEILDVSAPSTTTEPTATTTEPTTATKPTDPSATTTEGDKKPDASTAPAAYTDFTLPEGLTLSKETLEAATPIFRELGLSQEAAQKLVSFHADQLKAATASAAEASYTEMRKDWAAKTLSHPDIRDAVDTDSGKRGIDAVKINIGRALGALGDPALATEFKAAMDLTGAGDHPAFVRAINKFAGLIAEGKPVSGAGPSPEGQKPPGSRPPSAAQALYPNLPSAG